MAQRTPEQISKNMSRIRGKDTKIELLLRKELWKRGFRYRKNYRKLPGTPDIVFIKQKIAIFCDGKFWHSNNLDSLNENEYWILKKKKNVERDLFVNSTLKDLGWDVLRFWDFEIKHDIKKVIEEIAGLFASNR